MNNKISTKMSPENLKFWKTLNVNAIKTNALVDILSYSDLQTHVVKYFKLNNDSYLDLIELIKETEEKKNGAK